MLYDVLIKGLRSRILVYPVLPWYSTWAILEWQSCTQKSGSRLQNMTSHYHFFFIDRYNRMALWLRQVVVSRATCQWLRLQHSRRKVLKITAAPRQFCVALSPSVHWQARFSVAALSIIWCFFEFLQWQTPAESAADRVLTLNMNIRLPLFGALGVGPCARTRPHTLAWPMGSDCSYFIASEQKYLKSLRHCFPMNCLKIDSKILKR